MVSEHVVYANTLHSVLDTIQELSKAPPGPPPRQGLEWKEETHRWIRPKYETEEKPASQEFNDAVSRLSVGNDVQIIDGDKKGKLGTVDLITEDPDHGVLIEIDGEKGWIDPTNVVSIVSNSEGGQTPDMEADDERYNTAFGEKKPETNLAETLFEYQRQSGKFVPENDDSFQSVKENSILRWYKDGEFQEVGEKLRQGVNINESESSLMKEMFDLASPISAKQKVFRGIKGGLDSIPVGGFNEGEIIDFPSFTSTSRDPIMAAGFMGVHKSSINVEATFIEIDVPEGSPAITLSNNDDQDYRESETVLPAGQQYRVESFESDVDFSNVVKFRSAGTESGVRDMPVSYMKLTAISNEESSKESIKEEEGVKDKEGFISEFAQSFTMLGFSDLDPGKVD